MNNVVILTYPKLHLNIECPFCHDKFNKAVNVEYVKCLKCKNDFKPDLQQNVFSFHLPIIYNKLEVCNDVEIYSSESLFGYLMRIKEHFKKFGWFYIKDIDKHKLEELYQYCPDCGYCHNCVTCVSCDKHFEPKQIIKRIRKKDGLPDLPKTKCPDCKGTNLKLTYFKSSENKCPFCGSTKIKRTRLLNAIICNKCGSKNIKYKEHNPTNRLVISKIRAFRQGE